MRNRASTANHRSGWDCSSLRTKFSIRFIDCDVWSPSFDILWPNGSFESTTTHIRQCGFCPFMRARFGQPGGMRADRLSKRPPPPGALQRQPKVGICAFCAMCVSSTTVKIFLAPSAPSWGHTWSGVSVLTPGAPHGSLCENSVYQGTISASEILYAICSVHLRICTGRCLAVLLLICILPLGGQPASLGSIQFSGYLHFPHFSIRILGY